MDGILCIFNIIKEVMTMSYIRDCYNSLYRYIRVKHIVKEGELKIKCTSLFTDEEEWEISKHE